MKFNILNGIWLPMVLAPFVLLCVSNPENETSAIIGWGILFATACATLWNIKQSRDNDGHSMNWQSTKEILGTFAGSLAGAPLAAWLYSDFGLEWLQFLIGGVIGGLTIYFWRR